MKNCRNLCLYGLLSGCFAIFACQEHRGGRFERDWDAVASDQNLERLAPRFARHFPQLVDKINEQDYLEVQAVVDRFNLFYASTQLAGEWDRAQGDRRFLLAGILARSSCGTHEQAVNTLHQDVSSLSPSMRRIVLAYRDDLRFYRYDYLLYGSTLTRTWPARWRAMTLAQRWQLLARNPLASDSRIEEDRYRGSHRLSIPELLGTLNIDNWQELLEARYHNDFSSAPDDLEPQLAKTTGERQPLLATIIALCSRGRSAQAMDILAHPPADSSARLRELLTGTLDVIHEMQAPRPGRQ